MFKLSNGWTKERVMEQIRKYNNGTRSEVSEDGEINCLYKAPNGNRCAIGCFIPDDHPSLEWEGGVLHLKRIYPELMKLMPFDEPMALLAFQRSHDNSDGDVYQSVQHFLNCEVE
jgi:hypothetical protein